MITLCLQGQQEKLAPGNPLGMRLPPLYHQMRTLEALRAHDLVMNTYNTGTGKTVASLLYLFELNGGARNVLFIAPTNALLAQHAEDIERFVAQHDLDFRVLKATAAAVRALRSAQAPEALPHRPGDEAQQRALRAFVESQVAVTRALFNFRNAFQGPSAVIYDPEHLLSSQTVNHYSLFHLLCYYHLSPPLFRRQFTRECAETEFKGDFYFRLLRPREQKLSLEFVYDSEDEREGFERKWCGAPVALRGLRMAARQRGGDVVSGALGPEIVTALADLPLPVLILPPEDVGARWASLRGTDLWAQRLTVRFPDGTPDDGYQALIGTAAFHAHAAMLGHFLLKERMKTDAIII